MTRRTYLKNFTSKAFFIGFTLQVSKNGLKKSLTEFFVIKSER